MNGWALLEEVEVAPTCVASPVRDDNTLVSGEPSSLGIATLDEAAKSWKLVRKFARLDRVSGTHLEARLHGQAS